MIYQERGRSDLVSSILNFAFVCVCSMYIHTTLGVALSILCQRQVPLQHLEGSVDRL